MKRLLKVSATLAVSSFGRWPLHGIKPVWAGTKMTPFLIEGLGRKEGYSLKELTKKVFDAAGGIARFISRGDIVVIKPNISWARSPELAASTNPELMEVVIELCYEAGAKKVRLADNTIHDARRCFAITGAGMVAKKQNADLVYPRSSLMKEMKINGERLDLWPVFVPLVEADKVINLPVAKHHSLSVLTLGMKNWLGGVGGQRYLLHQDIHQSAVDLARFFKPTLTLVDAIRIMVSNGPSGGSLSNVVRKDTLILSDDQVAADARASLLFDRNPKNIGFIRLGQEQGLGTYDFDRLDHRKVPL